MADALYVATGVAAAVIGTAGAAGWTGNHTSQIAASWHEGTEQARKWWTAGSIRVRPALGRIRPVLSAAVLSLLALALRAHGRHRAGAA